MNGALRWLGDGAALAGILICVVAGAVRLFGAYTFAGVSVQSAFVMGVGLMVFACLVKLHLLAGRQ